MTEQRMRALGSSRPRFLGSSRPRFAIRLVTSCAVITLVVFAIAMAYGCKRGGTTSHAGDDGEGSSSTPRTAESSIEDAVAYLMSQQGEDGGWHAIAYGSMRQGAAITSLVLYALAQAPEEYVEPHRADLLRAAEFLSDGVEQKGYVCNPDGSADYSNYATAMFLIADHYLELEISTDHRQRMIASLLRAQIGSEHGYESTDVDFGGWDLSGWMTGRRRTAGTNISVSSLVVEALALQPGSNADIESAMRVAETWLGGCQNEYEDGGFFFHPEREHLGNKAEWTDDERRRTRSYGTSTADGLRMLTLLEVSDEDPRMRGARTWLEEHPSIETVPGFDDLEVSTGWELGLKFYYLFSLSTVIDQLDDAARAAAVRDHLISLQRTDGSWENENARMREDEPLIATPFALIAISRCLE